MAHDVFISYSSEDKLTADALCGALEAARIRCWVAPRDVVPALSYSGQITRAIKTSRLMVLIFSGHSNVSAAVLAEVEIAANASIHILNFRVDDSPLSDDLRFYLQHRHWFDALTPPMEEHYARLVQAIERLLVPSSTAEEPDLATPTPPQTPEESRKTHGFKLSLLGILVLLALVGGGAVAIFCWIHGCPSPHKPPQTPTPTPAAKSSSIATPESSPTIHRGDKANQTTSVQPPSSEYPKPRTSTPVLVEPSAAMSDTSFSKDRDDPTRLRSGEVRGTGPGREDRVRYYFSFLGGPGEVKVTFDFTASIGYSRHATATLFNQDFEKIDGLFIGLNPGETERKVKRIQVSQQQTMIVELDLSGTGAFLLRLEGAVRFP